MLQRRYDDGYNYADTTLLGTLHGNTAAEIEHVRRFTCACAIDADDARMLLDALGLGVEK